MGIFTETPEEVTDRARLGGALKERGDLHLFYQKTGDRLLLIMVWAFVALCVAPVVWAIAPDQWRWAVAGALVSSMVICAAGVALGLTMLADIHNENKKETP